jgi:hypothetical protein
MIIVGAHAPRIRELRYVVATFWVESIRSLTGEWGHPSHTLAVDQDGKWTATRPRSCDP